jgi:hypothetical protein
MSWLRVLGVTAAVTAFGVGFFERLHAVEAVGRTNSYGAVLWPTTIVCLLIVVIGEYSNFHIAKLIGNRTHEDQPTLPTTAVKTMAQNPRRRCQRRNSRKPDRSKRKPHRRRKRKG